MRLLAGVIIMLVLLVGFSLFIYYQTFEIADGLTTTLEQIEETVKTEEWDKASRKAEVLRKKWDRADAWWAPLMDHQEIDMLDQSIVKVARMVEVQCKEDVLIEVGVAKTLVKHISELQRLDIKNIL